MGATEISTEVSSKDIEGAVPDILPSSLLAEILEMPGIYEPIPFQQPTLKGVAKVLRDILGEELIGNMIDFFIQDIYRQAFIRADLIVNSQPALVTAADVLVRNNRIQGASSDHQAFSQFFLAGNRKITPQNARTSYTIEVIGGGLIERDHIDLDLTVFCQRQTALSSEWGRVNVPLLQEAIAQTQQTNIATQLLKPITTINSLEEMVIHLKRISSVEVDVMPVLPIYRQIMSMYNFRRPNDGYDRMPSTTERRSIS